MGAAPPNRNLMAIWKAPINLEQLNAQAANTLVAHLGMRLTAIGEDTVSGTMPVDQRTHQPFGLLHGGASVALAETLGSMAANLCCEPGKAYAVGLSINASHVRGVRSGHVHGVARALHVGRSTQVWEIEIRDDQQRLVCASRLTCAVVPVKGD